MNTIYTFAQSAIEEARSAGRYGTANLYSGAINSFRNFTGDIPLTFKEVTAGMIKKYALIPQHYYKIFFLST